MSKLKDNNQAGFTIVELLIATAVFSMVLMLCATAIVQVGKMYYKGTITNRTQDMSRKVIDDVSRAIQFGTDSGDPSSFVRPGSGGGMSVWCVGGVRYTYNTGVSQGSGPSQAATVLWRSEQSDQSCVPETVFDPNMGESLLGDNMRIPTFNITSSSNLWRISIVVSYGDTAELFETGSNFSICKGSTAGGQFCASARYETNVMKRL